MNYWRVKIPPLKCLLAIILQIITTPGIEGVLRQSLNQKPAGDLTRDVYWKQKINVIITPPVSELNNEMAKETEDTLELTCSIKYFDGVGTVGNSISNHSSTEEVPMSDYKLSWYLPLNFQNSNNRTIISPERNALNLIITKLKESDSGDYTCGARTYLENNTELTFTKSVKVTIKPKEIYCKDGSFNCPGGECIPKDFVCDNRRDCKGGIDESLAVCGNDPCKEKILCYEGRCLSKYSCIALVFKRHNRRFPPHSSDSRIFVPSQTSAHTVLVYTSACSCIMTFIFALICKFHLKRSSSSHRRPSSPGSNDVGEDSWENNLHLFHEATIPTTSITDELLVTHNFNSSEAEECGPRLVVSSSSADQSLSSSASQIINCLKTNITENEEEDDEEPGIKAAIYTIEVGNRDGHRHPLLPETTVGEINANSIIYY